MQARLLENKQKSIFNEEKCKIPPRRELGDLQYNDSSHFYIL